MIATTHASPPIDNRLSFLRLLAVPRGCCAIKHHCGLIAGAILLLSYCQSIMLLQPGAAAMLKTWLAATAVGLVGAELCLQVERDGSSQMITLSVGDLELSPSVVLTLAGSVDPRITDEKAAVAHLDFALVSREDVKAMRKSLIKLLSIPQCQKILERICKPPRPSKKKTASTHHINSRGGIAKNYSRVIGRIKRAPWASVGSLVGENVYELARENDFLARINPMFALLSRTFRYQLAELHTIFGIKSSSSRQKITRTSGEARRLKKCFTALNVFDLYNQLQTDACRRYLQKNSQVKQFVEEFTLLLHSSLGPAAEPAQHSEEQSDDDSDGHRYTGIRLASALPALADILARGKPESTPRPDSAPPSNHGAADDAACPSQQPNAGTATPEHALQSDSGDGEKVEGTVPDKDDGKSPTRPSEEAIRFDGTPQASLLSEQPDSSEEQDEREFQDDAPAEAPTHASSRSQRRTTKEQQQHEALRRQDTKQPSTPWAYLDRR